MRILIISHAYAIPIWLEKIQEISKDPSLEISVLTPKVFWDSNRKSVTYPCKKKSYNLLTGNVVFPKRVTGHFYVQGLKKAIIVMYMSILRWVIIPLIVLSIVFNNFDKNFINIFISLVIMHWIIGISYFFFSKNKIKKILYNH